MALWDKVKLELDRASQVAQGAFDEGKIRLEAFRCRQSADKAAQALGYAVYRARQKSTELEIDVYARMSSVIAGHEAAAAKLEEQVERIAHGRRKGAAAAAAPPENKPPS